MGPRPTLIAQRLNNTGTATATVGKTMIRQILKKKGLVLGLLLTILFFIKIRYNALLERRHGGELKSEAAVVVAEKRNGVLSRRSLSASPPRSNVLLPTSYNISFSPQPGLLNLHRWNDLCGREMQSLRNYPLFPNVPSSRTYISSLEISDLGQRHGKRIFGYLALPKRTRVNFRLLSSGSSEFWLSGDSNAANCQLTCRLPDSSGKQEKTCTESEKVLDTDTLYYFEILHKHSTGRDNLKLLWKTDGESRSFDPIPAKHFRLFQGDQMVPDDMVDFDSFPRLNLPMHRKNHLPKYTQADERRAAMHKLPFVTESDTNHLFPSCLYRPSYMLGDLPLKQYESVWRTHYTAIHPPDESTIPYKQLNSIPSFGNDFMDQKTAADVVNTVMDAIKRKHGRKYELRNVLNVEQNEDHVKGDRFLVELELVNTDMNRTVRFSEYVYRPQGQLGLCYPEGFKWNKKATVNIVLTAGGNQGKWVNYFIDSMARLYRVTQDKNFNVVIVDFHSPHLDVKKALEKSGLPNYILLENSGKFYKTLAIQQGLDLIQDPNQIVFQCDLHINIPTNLIDEIRKHTIQGKVTYCPVVARLECGANVHDPDGFWEVAGYGLVGSYKSDWDAFGGMDVEKYRHSWGGEDWDMADRIMKAQLELERLKVMNLFHYFHTKKGMWKEA